MSVVALSFSYNLRPFSIKNVDIEISTNELCISGITLIRYAQSQKIEKYAQSQKVEKYAQSQKIEKYAQSQKIEKYAQSQKIEKYA